MAELPATCSALQHHRLVQGVQYRARLCCWRTCSRCGAVRALHFPFDLTDPANCARANLAIWSLLAARQVEELAPGRVPGSRLYQSPG